MQQQGQTSAGRGDSRRRYPRLLASISALAFLASCGGSDGDDELACAPGLITGFNKSLDNTPLADVPLAEGVGEGGSEGEVGGGDGVGIGGADGQYRNVAVTVETADGKTYGPTTVDDTNGMVTFVGCDAQLPLKVTYAGSDVNATYYDEGLKADVSFFNRQRVGLISTLTKNAGVTPLSHALFDRAMEIGRLLGNAEGWKNPDIVTQAHTELLAIINDQLPNQYQLADLRSLPVPLNATRDSNGSGALPDSENGVYGALLAGLAKTAKTTLPGSSSPALDIADVLIRDLADAKLNLQDINSQVIGTTAQLPYTFDTLWTQAVVSTGETAKQNGAGSLQTSNTVIAYVRSGTAPNETEYVLGSNGTLLTVINPSVGGGTVAEPVPGVNFSEVLGFGDSLPVVALRRDGTGVVVFSTPANGAVFNEILSPTAGTGGTIVELMDGGSPVIRTSDGQMWRLDGGLTSFNLEPAPAGVISFTFRPEYDGALAPGDAELGADPNGAANNGLCVGASLDGKVRLWRPVFNSGDNVPGREQSVVDVVQVSSNQEISLGLDADGKLYHLDADHTVADNSLALVRPQSDPIEITAPKLCWLESPYAVACDGTAYEVNYPTFTDGTETRAGAITGLTQLPIPTTVWRTRSNRGANLVFLGENGVVYDVTGQQVPMPVGP